MSRSPSPRLVRRGLVTSSRPVRSFLRLGRPRSGDRRCPVTSLPEYTFWFSRFVNRVLLPSYLSRYLRFCIFFFQIGVKDTRHIPR